MSISALNRSSFSAPLSRTSGAQPLSTEAQSAESAQALQPQNGLRRMLMTDSFEQGPSALGGALSAGKSGGVDGIEKAMGQMSQVLGSLVQLLQSLEGPAQGGQDGGVGGAGGAAAAPQGTQAAPDALQPQDLAAPSSPASNAADSEQFQGQDNGAGPGFGAPSAGSTEQAAQPWLSRNNVGSPYNSNMKLIEPGQKSQYKYTNTFTNNTGKPQTVTLWNKTGQNGGPNDGQNFDKSTPKTFTLQPGQSQTVAFDTNSSVAWAVSKDGSAKPGANSGQTWGEATFANAATGWSGYDVSQISPAGHNGNMSIKNEATGKTVTQKDAWQTPQDDPAGHDVGVPAGPLNLSTVLS